MDISAYIQCEWDKCRLFSQPCMCVIYSIASRNDGSPSDNPACGVGIHLCTAVPLQLHSSAAAMCHQEEKENGGNL